MKHIVLDMEWNPTLGRRALNQEIIQMAALKYDASWNYEDAFETFIKPDFTPRISRTVRNLTGITDKKLKNAPGFAESVKKFFEWVSDREAIFHTYGSADRAVLEAECRCKAVDKSVLNVEECCWDDFQEFFAGIIGYKNKMLSLTSVMNAMDLSWKGRAHDARSDAEALAQLLLFQAEGRLSERAEAIRILFRESPSPTTSLGSAFVDVFLAARETAAVG